MAPRHKHAYERGKSTRREEYRKKLLDPRWQKKRLKILERDEWECQHCGDDESTLHVHHLCYLKGYEPWDYLDKMLITLCESCHEEESTQRPFQERKLIEVLKSRMLFHEDLEELSEAFLHMKFPHLREVTITALVWLLTSEEEMYLLMDRFFEHLHQKHGTKNTPNVDE
jgi:hypothetical protein